MASLPGEGNKRFRAGGGQRLSRLRQRPAIQPAGAGGAGAPLTGAHTAALGQFGLQPVVGGSHVAAAHILAAAQQALRRRRVFQRFRQPEGAVYGVGEVLPAPGAALAQ